MQVQRPIFFMHIAKTAGSYVNRLFHDALGATRAVEHIEMRLPNSDAVAKAVTDGAGFLSGHVYLRLWHELAKSCGADFLRLTVIRDPVEHLASHILWLDHYNLPEKRAEYLRLSEAHQRLVDLIGRVNFADMGMLDAFLTHLPAAGVQLLDNCQARYFVCGPGSATAHHDPLTLAHSDEIGRALRTFDLVIRQDRMEEGIARINALTGLTLAPVSERVNSAKSLRRIDTDNPVVRGIFSKRTLVDQWLWRTVSAADARRDAEAQGGLARTGS